ncbi:MAG: zinc-ribbon domain-containing protein, partial [Desulfurellaceae bacterium]|nr:zinc-ribbon domain-containing protein [Desulfurellaceae bacterium]
MVVACPACQTRYRVDAALVMAGETSFECCQEECGHVFVYTPPVLWKGNGQESETEPPSPPE